MKISSLDFLTQIDVLTINVQNIVTSHKYIKGPYADHILIPQGSTGSSIFFDIEWKPIFF